MTLVTRSLYQLSGFFSKILDRVIYNRLKKYLMVENLIVDQKFGFQKQKSTEAALIAMEDKIPEKVEIDNFTVGMFMDSKKAFYAITHNVLIDKWFLYEVNGTDLFKNYLSTRCLYTSLDDVNS